MKRSLRATLLSAAAVCLTGPVALSQVQLNELQLCNGGDILFSYSDPSAGFPTGTNPPDVAGGDYIWKVFPKEALRTDEVDGNGLPLPMEYTGAVMYMYDSDWTTDPSFYDMLFTRGTTAGFPADNIGPDFLDPNAAFLSIGSFAAATAGAGNPCLIPGNPLGCIGPCPPGGAIAGYQIEFSWGFAAGPGVGANGGLLIQGDGTADFVVTNFIPGGMSPTVPAGQCGNGDYTFSDLHSTNLAGGPTPGEFAVPTASGNSPYGGFATAGALAADLPDEVQDQPAQFQQSIAEGWTTLDPPVNPGLGTTGLGLASLRFPVGGGTNGYGVKLIARSEVNHFAFAFGSTFPQLPYPGIPFFGANFLINLGDPAVSATAAVWQGTVAFVPNGGAPFDDGHAVLPAITIPAIAAGLPLNMQGYTLDLTAPSLTLTSTGTFAAALLP